LRRLGKSSIPDAARRAALSALFALVLIAAPSAAADPPPPGSAWHENYIHESDGTVLHADVLRPADLPKSARTPVILSIGPYFNHSGQVGPAGPAEDVPYTPAGDAGPSARFFDFVNGAHLMRRGYTYVMVDLRGFGGSTGCLDWVGPGEQADVEAAVEWAARQPWSTGKVGIYGKSYDGVTGLIGEALHPKGLAAVVAQEPVYDLYRYLYMNRVRFENSLATPALYDAIAGTPGITGDTLAYQESSVDDTSRPACPALNWADQQDPNHSSPYWRQRDLIAKARGATTPLFLTQGFIEDNTKPDGAYDFFNGLAGPKRAWFGMWDHVRGNDTDEHGRLAMGRKGWFDEVMRWYGYYLKGTGPKPTSVDPPVAVESSDGTWRAEKTWPPPDARTYTAALRPGTYTDDATNSGTKAGGAPYDQGPHGEGIWTFSPKFGHLVRFAGVPRVTVNQQSSFQNANLTADVYDVDPQNDATLISRGTYLLGGTGRVSFDLYGDDWKLPAGHRLGVLIASSNSEWWSNVPTFQPVTVTSASITLPFLRCQRNQTIQGNPSIKLDSYLKDAPFQVPADTVDSATDPRFPVPPPLASC
jgi:predicted acyl esterase